MSGFSKSVALAAAAAILAAVAVLEWYGHAQPPAPAAPSVVPSTAPRSGAPLLPATTGQPAVSSPVPLQSPLPLVTRSPDAPPEIIAVTISSPVVSGGQMVTGVVQTSSNVASVEARIAGYSSSLTKVGVGRFALSYRVPNLPFFLHRTYAIVVIAHNARGQAVSSSLPITIR